MCVVEVGAIKKVVVELVELSRPTLSACYSWVKLLHQLLVPLSYTKTDFAIIHS